MRFHAPAFMLCVLPVVAADPSVTIDGISRDDVSGRVVVSYMLAGTDAIVTFGGDISSAAGAWTTLPDNAFRRVTGDVNKVVEASDAQKRTITWIPEAEDVVDAVNGFRARLTLWSPADPPDYMSVEIDGTKDVRYFTTTNALPYPVQDPYWKVSRILFRRIPAKDVVWNMASISANRFVKFTADYYIGVYPLLRGQHETAIGFETDRTNKYAVAANMAYSPQFSLTYSGLRGESGDDEATYDVASSSRIASLRMRTGLELDLPTEAQWEYACRAGCGTWLYTGEEATADNIKKLAWYSDNSGGMVHESGLKAPNQWGLYDMLGNVTEWCLDFYASKDNDYFADGTAVDPVGPATAQAYFNGHAGRVRRGGCFYSGYNDLKQGTDFRDGYDCKYGDAAFSCRLCCPIPGAAAGRIESGNGEWLALDTTASNSYWNCTAHENPVVVVATCEVGGVDFRTRSDSASLSVEPEGTLESRAFTEGVGYATELNSRKFIGGRFIFR